MWSALSRIGRRVLTRDTLSRTGHLLPTPDRFAGLDYDSRKRPLRGVQSPASVTDAFRRSHPSFSSSLNARPKRASLHESQERRKRLLAFTFCSPFAKSRRRAKSKLASLLIRNPAIHRNKRMNCASEALMLYSLMPKSRRLLTGARLASEAVARRLRSLP